MTRAYRLAAALAFLVALAGMASATPECPACDPAGEPGTNSSYSSVDLGVVEDGAETLVDTDASVADSDSPTGFFAWFTLCFTAFFDAVGDLVGLDLGWESGIAFFGSQDGVDVDASAGALGYGVDLDGTPLGELDGETWEIFGDAHDAGLPYVTPPVGGEAIPDGTVVEGCVEGYAVAVTC